MHSSCNSFHIYIFSIPPNGKSLNGSTHKMLIEWAKISHNQFSVDVIRCRLFVYIIHLCKCIISHCKKKNMNVQSILWKLSEKYNSLPCLAFVGCFCRVNSFFFCCWSSPFVYSFAIYISTKHLSEKLPSLQTESTIYVVFNYSSFFFSKQKQSLALCCSSTNLRKKIVRFCWCC